MKRKKKQVASLATLPWVEFNQELMKLTEAEVAKLLEHERAHQRRLTFVLRLHARRNKLRRERERGELLVGQKLS